MVHRHAERAVDLAVVVPSQVRVLGQIDGFERKLPQALFARAIAHVARRHAGRSDFRSEFTAFARHCSLYYFGHAKTHHSRTQIRLLSSKHKQQLFLLVLCVFVVSSRYIHTSIVDDHASLHRTQRKQRAASFACHPLERVGGDQRWKPDALANSNRLRQYRVLNTVRVGRPPGRFAARAAESTLLCLAEILRAGVRLRTMPRSLCAG